MEGEGRSEKKAKLERDGCLHIPGFCSSGECEKMLNHMAELVDSYDLEKTTAPVFIAYRKILKKENKKIE